MSTITKSEPFLFLLPASGPQKLSNGVVLIRYDLFCWRPLWKTYNSKGD